MKGSSVSLMIFLPQSKDKNCVLFQDIVTPEIAQQWATILQKAKQALPHQANAQLLLVTEDGLPIQPDTPATTQLAAITGFVSAAAKQASFMLKRQPYKAIQIQMASEELLICQAFTTEVGQLILAVYLAETVNYQSLIDQTIQAICYTLKEV